MSDDRMDRAERIRNMREGNRGTDDEAADDDAASATDGNDADTSAPGANESATAESDADPADSAADQNTTPTASEPDTTPTASEPDTTATQATDSPTQTDPVDSTATEPSVSDDAAAGASAAAERAAAAAAETMGEGGATAETLGEGDATTETPTMNETPDSGGGLLGQGPTGVELPDQQLLEEAMSNSTVEATEGAARAAAVEGETTGSEELVRVLEFSLGDEYYCLDIEYVEEIVKRNTVTRVPNTPEFVDGVVDLRGQITTILEPKEMMDIEAEGEQNLIVVFDPEQFEEQGAVGWVVDEVRQVVPVTESEVNEPPVDAEYINGVVDREEYDQFVIWIEPDDALSQATSGDNET